MKASTRTARLFGRWLVLALALAAIAVPAAQAANRPAGDALDRYLANNMPESRFYDSLDIVGSQLDPSRFYDSLDVVSSQPDASRFYDSLELVSSQPKTTPAAIAVAAEPGFDWADAGIGAGIAFGTMLLAAAALGVRSRGRVAHS